MPQSTIPNLSTNLTSTGPITRTLSFLMFLFGWTAMLATVLGFFGEQWWPFDVLADWRMICAVVLALAAVVTGLGYSRVSAVVFLAGAIINAYLIAPLWLESQPEFTAPERLRVVSLDVGFDPEARPAVIDWFNKNESDIVVLANAGGNWAHAIETFDVPYQVLTEDPALSGGTMVLARDGVAATIAEVPEGLGAVDVVITAPLAGREVTIVAFSVERPVSARTTDERIRAFGAVNARVRGLDGPAVIVGNLESSRWAYAFSVIAEGLTNSEDGFGYFATFPGLDMPLFGEYAGIPVDHALYQGPITVTHRRVGPDLGINHRPLLVDLSPADG
jgi:endonuclease/exonuclease/phosphatase (EEP) superfamily protein YafD